MNLPCPLLCLPGTSVNLWERKECIAFVTFQGTRQEAIWGGRVSFGLQVEEKNMAVGADLLSQEAESGQKERSGCTTSRQGSPPGTHFLPQGSIT